MSEAKEPTKERELTLTLPASAVQYIYEVLGERPYKQVSGLLEIIRDQVGAQNMQAMASENGAAPKSEPVAEEATA